MTMVGPPQQIYVHIALILANSFFGLGSIVGTLGLSTMNPLCFTFVRGVSAGILLLLTSLVYKSVIGRHVVPQQRQEQQQQPSEETESFLIATTMEEHNYHSILQSGRGHYKEEYEENYYQLLPQNWKDWKLFVILGFLVSIDLGAYIIGLHLAGPIVGSIWQPSIPILTAAISMLLLKLEKAKIWRIVGVLVAFGGCVSMVLLNNNNDHGHDDDDDDNDGNDDNHTHADDNLLLLQVHSRGMFLMGNLLFFSACMCDSCFVLLSKEVLKVYPPLTVTAWCYLLASPFLLVAALASSMVPSWQAIICPDCRPEEPWDDGSSLLFSVMSIPKDTLPAFIYYVLLMSMGAWGLILWANQYVTGTFVVGYSVLQPIMSTVFVVLLLMFGWVPDCQQQQEELQQVAMVGNNDEGGQVSCLDKPGVGALAGMVGIFVGLTLVIQTEPMRDEPRHPQWEVLKILSIGDFRKNHNAVYGSIVSDSGNENLLRP